MARHKKRLILFWKSFSVFAVSLTMAALYGCGGGGGSGSNDAVDGAGLVAGNADIGGTFSNNVIASTVVNATNVNATTVNAGNVSASAGSVTMVNGDNDVAIGNYLSVDGDADFYGNLTISEVGFVDATVTPVVIAEINSSVAGAWTGTLTNSSEISVGAFGVLFKDGDAWSLRLLIDSGECPGTEYSSGYALFDDEANSENIKCAGNIVGIAAPDCVFGNGSSTTSGTIDFIISGDNLTGTYSTEADSGTLNLTYDSIAVPPITSADLEGNWTLLWGSYLDAEITVDSNGNLTGTNPLECDTLDGQINIDNPESLLVSVEFTATDCINPETMGTGDFFISQPISALLVFNAEGDAIYIMVSDNPLSNIFY